MWLHVLFSLARADDVCASTALPRDGVVLARVDGVPITEGLVRATVAQLPQEVQEQIEARGQLEQVQEQVILSELLTAEACRRGLPARPDVRTAMALSERNALATALLEEVVVTRTTPELVQAWYQDHLVRFARPQVHARHILVADKATAERLLGRIRAGEAFATLATQASIDPGSAADGGDLGWFGKDAMVGEFADATFAAPVGQPTGPVQTTFGWHLILVEERRNRTPIEAVEAEIRAELRDEVVEAYIEDLKGQRAIER